MNQQSMFYFGTLFEHAKKNCTHKYLRLRLVVMSTIDWKLGTALISRTFCRLDIIFSAVANINYIILLVHFLCRIVF